MGYVEDNLMPNEKVLLKATVHPMIYILPAVICIISLSIMIYSISLNSQKTASAAGAVAAIFFCLSGMFFLSSLLLFIEALIIRRTTEFAVTSRRVIAKTGFIRRHSLEILIPKIESVSVNQNILGRISNFGNVTVTGTGGSKETFKVISRPMEVKRKINQVIERYNQIMEQRNFADHQSKSN